MGINSPNSSTLGVLRALISLSRLDWLYADQYLRRAERLLSKFFPRVRYAALKEDQESVPRLTKELREATERRAWSEVRTLAHQAAEARRRLVANSQVLAIADDEPWHNACQGQSGQISWDEPGTVDGDTPSARKLYLWTLVSTGCGADPARQP